MGIPWKVAILVLCYNDFWLRDHPMISGRMLWGMVKFLSNQWFGSVFECRNKVQMLKSDDMTILCFSQDNPKYNCAREVSTIVCVHEPECSPRDCSGHGSCVLGECVCKGHWSGKSCDLLTCPEHCSGHGTCLEGMRKVSLVLIEVYKQLYNDSVLR